MAIKVRERQAFSWYERSYIFEILRGLWVTFGHLFRNLYSGKEIQTVRYPEEKRTYPMRYRGQHRLLAREDGSPRCVACYMCATACPAYCIHIIAAESDNEAVEKYPASFEIDLLRCVYCGLCEEACPEDAIRMDTGLHVKPFYQRQDALVGRVDLMQFVGQPGSKPAYGAQNARENKPIGA